MSRTVQILSTVVALTLLFFGCIRTNSGGVGRNGPRGDAEGFLGVANATFENIRTRCNFTTLGKNHYSVVCRAVVIDKNGNEMTATGLAAGLQLTWIDPQKVFGSDLQSFTCTAGPLSLSYVCDITLAQDVPTDVLFQMQVVDVTNSRNEIKSDAVLFPYSVTSYGVVPPLAGYQLLLPPSPSAPTDSQYAGFQTLDLDPSRTSLSNPTSLCFQRDRIFFTAENFVYVLENGKLHHYSGNSNVANILDLSHRLQIAYSSWGIGVTCYGDKVFVSDPGNERIVALSDEGPVTSVIGVGGTPGNSPDGASAQGAYRGKIFNLLNGALIYNPFILLFDSKGFLYFNDSNSTTDSPTPVVRFIDGNGKLGTVRGITNLVGIDKNDALYTFSPSDFTIQRLQGMTPVIVAKGTSLPIEPLGNIVFGPDNSFYYSESIDFPRVRHVDLAGNIQNFAGNGQSSGPAGDNGPAQNATVVPSALALSSVGLVYFADKANNSIRHVDANNIIHTDAGPVSPLSDAGTTYYADSALFGKLDSIRIGPDGALYVTDETTSSLRKIQPSDGTITTVLPDISTFGTKMAWAGNRLYMVSGQTGIVYEGDLPGLNMNQFSSIPVVFIAKFNGYQTPIGGYFDLFAGSHGPSIIGSGYMTPVDPTMPSASLYGFKTNSDGSVSPIPLVAPPGGAGIGGVTVDGAGNIYATELGLSRIIKWDASGQPNIIAGPLGQWSEGFADGWGAVAQFNKPMGIAATPDGNLYVADSNNGRIRLVQPKTLPDGSQGYFVSTFSGGNQQPNCTGSIKGSSTLASMDANLKASLSEVCQSAPQYIDAKSNCGLPGGKIFIAYTQRFGNSSNVVYIERPCP